MITMTTKSGEVKQRGKYTYMYKSERDLGLVVDVFDFFFTFSLFC